MKLTCEVDISECNQECYCLMCRIIMQRFLDELRELEMQLAQGNDKRQNGSRVSLHKSMKEGT